MIIRTTKTCKEERKRRDSRDTKSRDQCVLRIDIDRLTELLSVRAHFLLIPVLASLVHLVGSPSFFKS